MAHTRRAIVIEEDCCFRGGAEIAASLNETAFFALDSPVRRVGGADVPTPYNAELEQASIPRAHDVVRTVQEMLGPRER